VDSSNNESAPSDTVLGSPITGVAVKDENIPFTFRLYQNYPNPFNPITMIPYEIGKMGPVHLTVYDALGREVTTLVNDVKKPGVYLAVWDAGRVASGIYIVRLRAEGRAASVRAVLIK
jgi:hypothetical protein